MIHFKVVGLGLGTSEVGVTGSHAVSNSLLGIVNMLLIKTYSYALWGLHTQGKCHPVHLAMPPHLAKGIVDSIR